MITSVRARYSNGALVPLEPLDLEEGKEVMVSVEDPSAGGSEETAAATRGLAAIVDEVRERQKDIPPEEWADIPPDLAKNHKHYLYGHPKEED